MIKQVLISLSTASLIFILLSCRSSKETATLSVINGEWSIVEINGSAVVPASGQEYPYIGFETTTGKVYGNSGCNRIMGSFDTKTEAGALNLGQLAGTRMMCQDMTMERNVLNTLKNVKGYKVMGNKIALTNSRNRPIIMLDTKKATTRIASLEGEWKITEVNGEAIPAGLERKPFLSFEVEKKRVHGNAGCNMINGGYITDDENPRAISFPAMAATMMACPDMTLERKVMNALNEVKTYDIFNDKSAGLYNGAGELIVKLAK